jgi:hypothetical protein
MAPIKTPSSKTQKQTDGATEAIATTPEIMAKVASVMMTGDPAKIAALNEVVGEDLESWLNDRIYHAAEGAKPAVRRAANAVTDTTLGTILEKFLILVGGGVGCYVVGKGINSKLEARKERKLAEASALLDD